MFARSDISIIALIYCAKWYETVQNAGASMLSTGAQVIFDEQLSLQQKCEQVLAAALQQLSPVQMAMNATMAFGFEKATQGVIGATQRVAPELPMRVGNADAPPLGTSADNNDDWGCWRTSMPGCLPIRTHLPKRCH